MSRKYRLERIDDTRWRIPRQGGMRTEGLIFADDALMRDIRGDPCVEQVANVAHLPGIVGPSMAMPDIHWGYGFPIGGVAAFDTAADGVVSAGGVGFDISCGVRTLHMGVTPEDIESVKQPLADALLDQIPAGLGSTGAINLDMQEMDAMLAGGAAWAVSRGWGREEDLERVEEHGCMPDAAPAAVSELAKQRQHREMGTLGSGNHYLEIQRVTEIFEESTARAFGLYQDAVVVSIHCGSRGLGHQIGTEFLKAMVLAAPKHGIRLPDRELACAPIDSDLGRSYLGAMRAGINCALANRQIITDLTRQAFADFFPDARLPLLYDVSHNTCKVETHEVRGQARSLFVHRKGATRAFGPGHPDLPDALRSVGQPVLIGGTMGTASYILVGTAEAEKRSFSSACHGAGRAMSRRKAMRTWKGRQVVDELAQRGIIVRSPSLRGVAEEAPGAYKDVDAVVDVTHDAGLARKVARLEPMICIKG